MIKEFWITVLALKSLWEPKNICGNLREFSHISVLWSPRDPSRWSWFGVNAEPWCKALGDRSVSSFPALVIGKLAESGCTKDISGGRQRSGSRLLLTYHLPLSAALGVGPLLLMLLFCWGEDRGRFMEGKESPPSSSLISFFPVSLWLSREMKLSERGRRRREKGGKRAGKRQRDQRKRGGETEK